MTMRKQQMNEWRRWALGAVIIAAVALVGGCGPNDRLRDDYMGKPTPPEYKPIQRDGYGNPIIPEAEQAR
jgi:hypothetical protein